MRTAGFPCRAGECDRSFQVADQNSMDALKEASRLRSDHEVSEHGYRHVMIASESARPWTPRSDRNGKGRT